MKVKIVLVLVLSMLLLTSCFGKDKNESWDNESISWNTGATSEEVEHVSSTYSSIGGSGGTPEDTIIEFNN